MHAKKPEKGPNKQEKTVGKNIELRKKKHF